MKLLDYLKNIEFRKYGIFLAVSVLLFFATSQTFQSRLVFHNFDMVDAYPGYPILPEPYEIPLYFLSYLVIPLLALALYSLWRFRIVKLLAGLAALGIAAKFGLTLINLHLGFSLLARAIHYLSTHSFWHLIWLLATKRLYIVRVSLLAGLGVFALTILWPLNVAWFRNWDTNDKLKKFLPYLLILLVILLFHPNFPSQEGFTNFVLTPASEIIHGKPLLYETTSIYGILDAYLTALLVKFVLLLSFKSMAAIIMVMYFLFYFLLYKLLKLWSNSTLFALFGTWLAIIAGFFLLTDPYVTAYSIPGQSAFRQGFWIFSAFLIARFMRNPGKFKRELILAMAAISFFWNIDTGIYISIATFVAMAYAEFDPHSKWLDNLKKVFIVGFKQLGYLVALFGIITAVNYLVYHAWPNWHLELVDISTFNTGYGKYLMPKFGLYELFVGVYSAFLLWIFIKLFQRKKVDLVIIFLTIYGIFSFVYYVGNSVWSYLNFISIPMLLLSWFALYRYIKEPKTFISPRLVQAVFYGLLGFAAVMTVAKVPVVFAYRNYADMSLTSVDKQFQPLYEDAQYIKIHFPQTRIPVFHENDGRLLIMADKVNSLYLQSGNERLYSLYSNYLVIYRRHVQGLIQQVIEMRPQYVFITNQSRKDPRFADFEDFVKTRYTLSKSLNTLNIYELK